MNIIITGGGTGGHLYPGLELAKHLRDKGNTVYYVASQNGIDKDIIESQDDLQNIQIKYWDLRGLNRSLKPKAIFLNFQNIFKLIKLLNKSKKLIKQKNIDVVIGVGGYISYPLVKVASDLNVYTIIHEQNSYPGLVNRKLAKYVNKVTVAYKESRKYFGENILEVSNPRVDLTQKYINRNFHKELNLNPNKEIVLFLGGSLGAKKINELFFEFVQKDVDNKYQCVLISGMLNNEVEELDLKDHIILENTNQLIKYMSTADYIISRGGATTILEIVYLEKKSIIIPSPNVAENHQYYNALEFYEKNMLYVILEKDLEFDKFLFEFNKLKKDEQIKSNLQKYDKILSLSLFDKIIEEIHDN